MNWEDKILQLMRQEHYTPLDGKGLARHLRLQPRQQSQLRDVLSRMEHSGRIVRVRQDRYALPLDADLVPGRILINRSGGGILQPEDPKLGRIVIPSEATATALHHDRVLVRRETRPGGGQRAGATGKVIRILERARTQIVGTLQRSRQFLYIIPDDPRIPHDVYVLPGEPDGRAPEVGDKVVVELTEWLSRHNNPEGRIVEVLGHPDDTAVDMESILRQYNLTPEFPPNVVQASRRFPETVQPAEGKGRRDCRQQNVVTIDPDDAKDFDDAFCLERADGQQWRLWVHIADVSHYVKPDSVIDEEARRRGNSTYLVDRVIPMLPEQLSNELCSLKPAVDRLTKCVEFRLTNDGRVTRTDFYPAIIHSRRRFTYGEALTVLRGRPGNEIERMLIEANRLAQRIRQARMKAGSLNLDFPETKIRLDEQGRVRRVEKVENDISHQLIEEFMLLANEAVASRLKEQHRPSIYRIHEQPDAERLEELREELKVHGIRCGNLSRPREVQKMLEQLNAHPAGDALKISFLRSLKRARYATEPLGHYGLAKANYTHFTSPIRRYADLVVHRSLFEQVRLSRSALGPIADHISFTERNSADAEQDSKTVKLLAYLEAQLRSGRREVYTAMVSDVRNFGFFVEVSDLGMSGMVRVSTLDDDFYIFEASRNELRGRRHNRRFVVGNVLSVQVHSVDRFKKQVNFTVAGKQRPSGRRRTKPAAPRPQRVDEDV